MAPWQAPSLAEPTPCLGLLSYRSGGGGYTAQVRLLKMPGSCFLECRGALPGTGRHMAQAWCLDPLPPTPPLGNLGGHLPLKLSFPVCTLGLLPLLTGLVPAGLTCSGHLPRAPSRHPLLGNVSAKGRLEGALVPLNLDRPHQASKSKSGVC